MNNVFIIEAIRKYEGIQYPLFVKYGECDAITALREYISFNNPSDCEFKIHKSMNDGKSFEELYRIYESDDSYIVQRYDNMEEFPLFNEANYHIEMVINSLNGGKLMDFYHEFNRCVDNISDTFDEIRKLYELKINQFRLSENYKIKNKTMVNCTLVNPDNGRTCTLKIVKDGIQPDNKEEKEDVEDENTKGTDMEG